MLARLTRPVPAPWGPESVPAGTIGTVRKCLRGGEVFRLRSEPRTIVVTAEDYEPAREELPPLPAEPRVGRLRLVGAHLTPTERSEIAAAPAWVQRSDRPIPQRHTSGADASLEAVVACAVGLAIAFVLAVAHAW